ncbi:MAG TPA: DnaA/Hda family protein [Geobacteraceae bacterium]|nr:DnaA/Hda family protein [Geobacteraceae bacterium]
MQLIFDFPIRPHYTFANFVTCRGNEVAINFARRVMDPVSGENLLFLHGPEGSGKTHLLTAVSHAGSRDGVAVPVFPVQSLTPQSLEKIGEEARDLPLLLLDDLHLIQDDDRVRVALWQMFNDFYSSGRKIVVTATAPPKELPHLDGHLVSRLLWGLVAKLDISDDDSRRMIMGKLAADRQIALPAEVIDYLLLHVQRDIPALTAALEQIKRMSFTTKRKISLRLAREALALPPEAHD